MTQMAQWERIRDKFFTSGPSWFKPGALSNPDEFGSSSGALRAAEKKAAIMIEIADGEVEQLDARSRWA